MIQIFKLSTYLFFKNKLLISIFGLSLIVTHLVSVLNILLYRHNSGGTLMLFQSLISANFMFIIFVFLSYEYFYVVSKSNLLEVLKSTKLGTLKLYSYQFLVILLLNVIITLSHTAYNVGFSIYYGFVHSNFLIHILGHMFLNLFIVLIIATLIGWILALVFKRLTAYMIAILFMFLGSQIFEEIALETLFSSQINLYQIYNAITFSDPALTWSTNFHFGYSLLPDRFWIMLAWLSVLFSIILFKLVHKQSIRYSLTTISLLVFVVSISYYQQPSSRFVMSHTPNGSLMYDYFYYEGKEIQREEANFNVLSYDLEMVVGNQLEVIAILTVDENLPEYRFTLYHRYVITKVTNQTGEEMEFLQEGDYFSVHNNVENLEEMIIHYVGYSPRFYSNRQGVILPGFFPYFPQSGYHLVYDYQWETFEPVMLAQEADFNIKITGAGDVFSNLEEIAPNHFSGHTSSVTLISGFLNYQVIDGITVIYPFLDHMEFNHDLNSESTRNFIRDFSGSDDIRTIMVLPNLNLHHLTTVVHSDHITTRGLLDLAELSNQSLINPRKFTLYELINLYLNDIEWFYDEVAWELSVDMYDEDRFAVMIQDHIKGLGLDLFLDLAISYIEDDTDTRSISEFLLELEEEKDHVRN